MLKSVRRKDEFRFLVVDIIMVVLLLVNLTWIVFDWLYTTSAVRNLLIQWTPEFQEWYGGAVHPNFVLIDLVFVAVFLTDFFIGWIVAAAKRSYHRWFFYPFIHWYDLLGCIPVAGFRFLRLLRVISIVYRLHKAGIIDLSDTGLGRSAAKYYAVLVEEVSDRVVVKMLSDVQLELKNGSPVMEKIVADVIRPQKAELVEWMSHRVEYVASRNYDRYQEEAQRYVHRRVATALKENEEFARLGGIPIAGAMIQDATERAISDMVSNVTRGILQDVASEQNKPLLDELADIIFDAMLVREEDSELSRMVVGTLDRSLEIIKKQVNIQQWKLKERARNEDHMRELVREELQRLNGD
ncbi:MAG: ion transporter [bacterium]